MKLQDIAHQIYIELDEPDDLSISFIQFWLSSNIGTLNNLLGTAYELDSSSSELTTDLGNKESAILKLLYLIKDLDSKIRLALGASGVSSELVEASSDGGVIRFSNKTEVAKTYVQLRKERSAELEDLVNSYNINSVEPGTISGSDILDVEVQPTVLRIRI